MLDIGSPMIRPGLPLRNLMPVLRFIPALSWLLIQLSMAMTPVTANATTHDAEINALFEILGTDRIVLCTPEGNQVFERHQDHAEHSECDWCQGFASAVSPTPPTASTAVALSAVEIRFRHGSETKYCAGLQTCHPSRAPPVLI